MAGMRLWRLFAVLMLCPNIAHGLLIDDFSSGAFIYTVPNSSSSSGEIIQDADDFSLGGTPPLGTLRTLNSMDVVGGPGSSTTFAIDTHEATFRIDNDDNENRRIYRYFDLYYGPLQPPSGVDLTADGADRLRITLGGEAPGSYFELEIYGRVNGLSRSLATTIGDSRSEVVPFDAIIEVPFNAFLGDPMAIKNVVGLRLWTSRLRQDTAISRIETASSPLAGDLNRDGVVNPLDYETWRSSYLGVRRVSIDGVLSAASGSNRHTTTVDANRDGQVNAADYAVWRDAYDAIQQQNGNVPEPGSIALLAPLLLCRRLRGRRSAA